MDRPLLIFDGECGYCRRWVRRLQPITGDKIEFAPFQEAAPRAPQIPPEEFARLMEESSLKVRGVHPLTFGVAVLYVAEPKK